MAGPFRKILIANRGEIAVRIVRACRDLGVASLAVYSEADREALHVELADEAVCCGGAPAAESYLALDRLVALAREHGADAVHPGYGFLSESAELASAVQAADLTWIGPSPGTIRSMGDKLEARRRMQAAGVPVLPGSLDAVSPEAARAAALEIGFPLLIKASAGGGGRGMRLLESADALEAALPRARSEAERGFGDASVYLERYVEGARHVEVQVLGDAAGRVIHLYERDCSVQRRHQKLIEESPCPALSPDARTAICELAVRAASAVSYVGAGTVELLLEPSGQAWFLEMNTRIQVEHPVTEAVTGIDLVAAGIRVAAGEPLGLAQHEIVPRGHAIELRIYAEDPDRGFRPSPGTITRYRAPEGPGVRMDSGVREGSVVPVYYDALLAKLICHGADRSETLARARRALCELDVRGVHTTASFHRRALDHPDMVSGVYDTRFVERLRAASAAKP